MEEIKKSGRKAVAIQLDVANVANFGIFVDAVQQTLGSHWNRESFDFLINNAGTGIDAAFIETTEEQFDQMMNVHFKGVFFLTQRLLPVLADKGNSINISTGLAHFSLPGKSAYASMTGAIDVLSRYLAKKLGPRELRSM